MFHHIENEEQNKEEDKNVDQFKPEKSSGSEAEGEGCVQKPRPASLKTDSPSSVAATRS